MDELYLFNVGQNYQVYKALGAFPDKVNGVAGYRFAVWAPHAKSVAMAGDFNDWQKTGWNLEPDYQTGVWQGFFPNLCQWQKYKYVIEGQDGEKVLKCDPFARHAETRPGSASILYEPDDFEWSDEEWTENRGDARACGPLNVYEMHLGSWRRYADGNVYNYRDIAGELADYLQDMGYNAVEFMPLAEYPFDDSWGYQVTGYFSVTSRYGTPAQFKYLVNRLHHAGIRVIMDWVPAHFPRDEFGLARFDGSPLYEYADPRIGEHSGWGTLVFDYSKKEVISFLLSSACFWLEECHIDGLRVDAVSAMLYLNYDRRDFLRNREGGLINLEAVEFLHYINSIVARRYPGVMMIAEEATTFPHVTRRVEEGGLGFTHKWNMGWMHDTLDYMSLDYIYRKDHHNQLTFSLTYAFSERYVLAISHDEVVHGKHSLLDKMPGDIWRKFACLRLFLMYQMAHPGAKLNFMGYEIGQFVEWRFKEELEWFLLEFDNHRLLHDFVRELNHLYLSESCFWEKDSSWEGFVWNCVDDNRNSVLAFTRVDGKGRKVLCLFNMTPATIPVYRLEVGDYGRYRTLMNSDDLAYGGSGNRGESTKDQVYTTLVPSGQAALREMEALRKNRAAREGELRRRREEALHYVDAYLEALAASGATGEDSGRADAGKSLQIEAALPEPQLGDGAIKPELELALPPLCGQYLIYEGDENEAQGSEQRHKRDTRGTGAKNAGSSAKSAVSGA